MQLDHRVLALTTFAAYTAVFVKARKPNIWTNIPEDAKRAMMLAVAAVGGQVLQLLALFRGACFGFADAVWMTGAHGRDNAGE